MKEFLILVFTVVITLSISTTAFAIDVFYQNEKVEMDVQPKVINGSTLVPIRAINTALKGETKWNQAKQQVEIVKGGHKIILEIGKNSALVDAKVVNQEHQNSDFMVFFLLCQKGVRSWQQFTLRYKLKIT